MAEFRGDPGDPIIEILLRRNIGKKLALELNGREPVNLRVDSIGLGFVVIHIPLNEICGVNEELY